MAWSDLSRALDLAPSDWRIHLARGEIRHRHALNLLRADRSARSWQSEVEISAQEACADMATALSLMQSSYRELKKGGGQSRSTPALLTCSEGEYLNLEKMVGF